ncbi:unnamed protein product, partial [Iphiclides podalirius]
MQISNQRSFMSTETDLEREKREGLHCQRDTNIGEDKGEVIRGTMGRSVHSVAVGALAEMVTSSFVGPTLIMPRAVASPTCRAQELREPLTRQSAPNAKQTSIPLCRGTTLAIQHDTPKEVRPRNSFGCCTNGQVRPDKVPRRPHVAAAGDTPETRDVDIIRNNGRAKT